MATAKTTNTKPKATTKPTAKSTTKTTSSVKTAPVQPETVKETVVEVKAVEVKPQPKTYAPTDGITCESVTFGKLGLIGAKTGLNYEWLNEGDTIEVEYQDLIAELNRGSSYVLKPYFVVLDDDIIDKYPKVKSLYASMYSLDEMRDALHNASLAQLKQIAKNLPGGAKKILADLAKNEVAEGQFDSLSKMKALDEIQGTNQVQLVGLIG